jgi:hypothetical protein
MKKRTRIFYISSVIVIGLISLVYALFPLWAQILLERNLPNDWRLHTFSIERPSLGQLRINQITINDAQDHSLTVTGVLLKFSPLDQQLESITIDKLDGQLSLEFLMKKALFDVNNDAELQQQAHLDKPIRLPQIALYHLAIKLELDPQSSIQFSGQIDIDPSAMQGEIQVMTSWNDQLRLQLEQKKQQMDLAAQLRSFSLAKWMAVLRPILHRLAPQTDIELSHLTGQVSGLMNAHFLISKKPNDAGLFLFDLASEPVWLMALESDLTLQELSLYQSAWNLQELNAGVKTHFKQGQWQTQIDQLTSIFQLNHSLEWLNKSTLSIHSDELLLSANTQSFDISGLLEVEQQTIRLNSHWPWDKQQNSQHQIALTIQQLDERWSPWLQSLAIANINADMAFELKQVNGRWVVLNAKSGLWELKDVTLKQPLNSQLGSAQLQLIFAPQFRLDQPEWLSAVFNIEALNIESKPWMTWTQVDLLAEATRESDKISVTYQVNPSTKTLLSQKLLLTGTEIRPHVSGTLAINSNTHEVDATVKSEVALYSSKAMLSALMSKQKKLLQEVTITEPLQVNASLSLNGKQAQQVQLNGEAELVVPAISLGDISATKVSIQLQWPRLQHWFQVSLNSQFELDYLKKDRQYHRVELDAWLQPEFKFQHLVVSSRLFGGEAELVANENYRSWSNSIGQLTLSNIQLEKVSDLLDAQDLSFSGRLSGKLPFVVEQEQLYFKQGELHSERGQVNYIPGGVKKELTKESASDIASIALQNFHYRSLVAKLNRGGPCGFDFDIRLEGHNPDLGNKAEQIFNIKYQPASNVNLYYLLTLGEDFIQQLEQEQLHSACVH